MAIVGALEDGMRGRLLNASAIKAVLDAVIVMVLPLPMERARYFPHFRWDCGRAASAILPGFWNLSSTPQIVSDLSFTGNVLIFCVGVNLAFGKIPRRETCCRPCSLLQCLMQLQVYFKFICIFCRNGENY